MNHMNNSRTKRCSLPCRIKEHWSPLILFVNLAAYIGFALIDGPVWCRDSNSYATMDYTREPIYPTFLWLMRKLFGENVMVHGWDLTDRLGGKAPAMEPLYLMAVIVVQSILAAVTVWLLSKLCYEISGKLRFAAAANLVMWGVDLLNRFGAKRGSTYTQSYDRRLWRFLLYPVPSEPFSVSEAAPQNGARKRNILEEISPAFCSDDGFMCIPAQAADHYPDHLCSYRDFCRFAAPDPVPQLRENRKSGRKSKRAAMLR